MSQERRSKSPVRESRAISENLRKRVWKWIGRRLGIKGMILEKTTPAIPSYVFEPEPVIRRPDYDYVNLFEVATTSWPLRRSFRAIIQESTRNKWSIIPKFKWKCTNDECGKEYSYTPNEDKLEEGKIPTCIAKLENEKVCGSKLREPSERQWKLFDLLLKHPNRDYGFADFVRSTLFYDLALDDWYWGITYKRRPKKNKAGKIIIQNKQVVEERVPAEIYIEDSRFIFPVADDYGHLGGYEWFCPECYGKGIYANTGSTTGTDQPVVEILPDMSLEQQEKLKLPRD